MKGLTLTTEEANVNNCCRLGLLALAFPLLHGCAAGIIAAQAIPTAIGAISIAGAEDRSPFRIQMPAPKPATDKDLAVLDANIRQAECGDAQSQYWLASALQNGFNTTPNSIEIYKWYRLAEIGEFAPASERLRSLDAKMSASEIAEARRRAQIWRAATEGCDASG